MSSQPLNRIVIQGYKSIRDAEVKLRPLNVLIGANGAGKSNFIGLFNLLNAIIEQRLQKFSKARGVDSLLHFGRKVTSAIEVELEFEGAEANTANLYRIILAPSDRDTLFLESEECAYWRKAEYDNPRWYAVGAAETETRLFEAAKRTSRRSPVDDVIDALQDWKIYHFHDTSESSRLKQPASLQDNHFFRPDASNLAAFLYFLQEQHPHSYTQIVRTVQQIAPFFDTFVLAPERLNPENERIRLAWRHVEEDTYFDAHALSDGTLRFMCLATLLLQPELPSVILIDEPELGLHPVAITLLASLLRLASARTQVIVSTQSVPLINQLDPEDLIVVEREDQQSVFTRLNSDQLSGWLEEYGLGDLWEKNVLGGRPTR
ncbi:MAG: AAA family ATPase [bacterium]|nr:AAA family ATPase [bacterium]